MPTSSQGHSFGGLDGLTNVKYKTTRDDPTSSSNRIDASTLALADGADRVYVDGLPDAGSGSVGGITETVTATGLSASAPSVGTTYSGYKCTESEIEYAVGELVKWTASFTAV
jgi:hypothetical protein